MRIRANNPSPMTLTGTNTYVINSADDTSSVLIDPGPELAEHRDNFLAEIGDRRLTAIVLTHQHADHSEMLGSVEQWAPDVPVYAVLEKFSRLTPPVADGDRIAFGTDTTDVLEVVATPGHTMDSISLIHDHVLYSGDTVLGKGRRSSPTRKALCATIWSHWTGCCVCSTRDAIPASSRHTVPASNPLPRCSSTTAAIASNASSRSELPWHRELRAPPMSATSSTTTSTRVFAEPPSRSCGPS